MPELPTLPDGFVPSQSKPLPFEAPAPGLRLAPGVNVVAIRELGELVTIEVAEVGTAEGTTIQSQHCWHCHDRPGSPGVVDCYEIRCPPTTHEPPTI